MSRRPSRRSENIALPSDPIENGDTPRKKARRSTKPTKRETEEDEDEENTPATASGVEHEIIKSEAESEEEKAPVARKINSVKGKTTLAKKEKPAAGLKRKAKPEEGEEDDEGAASVKPTKKRKTKEAKAAEAMPAAERTIVSTLRKQMYIGAHVSAAKGMVMATIRSPRTNSCVLGRCPKLDY